MAADNIGSWVPKNKHLLGGGSQSKNRFNTANLAEIRAIVADGLRSPGANFLPNNRADDTFRVVVDVGRPVGVRGETRVRIIVAPDGQVLNAFPVQQW